MILFPIVVAQVLLLLWIGYRAVSANRSNLRRWVLEGDGQLSEACVAALLRDPSAAADTTTTSGARSDRVAPAPSG